ncbi:MAG: hypothetical protein ACI9FR_000669 [Cryomorphaceae bacterium]
MAVFVFVHGWKHNAGFNDSSVVQFRDFLSRAAENEVVGRRKVIGLYLGWRGDFTSIPLARETTYWARKSVAEEIGAGGATEIFSQLHKALVSQFESSTEPELADKNSYVIIGHSFGGAIVLSALHDVLLKDLVAANTSVGGGPNPCARVNRFADALVLLNPAIEANKVILLKEAAARCSFENDQNKLMHVLSSEGDRATRIFFPIGQYANLTSPLGPKKLKRRINGKDIILDERRLDVETAGNLQQIRTSFLSFDNKTKNWKIADCGDGLAQCGVVAAAQKENHIATSANDPLAFIKTDSNFMRNHGDVFNCYVQSFITAVIFENQSIAMQRGSMPYTEQRIEGCTHNDFKFNSCFYNQLDDYDCAVPGS